jgi:hypothetical protein
MASDKVCVETERLIVHAAEAMDWPVREFCRVPIIFRGQKYYVRSKRDGERAHTFIYELWLWPEKLQEASVREVVYDEAYVIERDKAAARSRRRDRLHFILLPFYPFLGLFWSGFKNRTLGRLGFVPISITRASIAVTFNLFIAEGIFVGWLGGGILTYFSGWPGLRPIDWTLLISLGADSVMRFGQSLEFDVERCWGFCEWVRPRKVK